MDLSTRIRSELDDGRTVDEIVADLVANGMTEPNARRIVEKASLLPRLPKPGQISTALGPREAAGFGTPSLIVGALLVSLGATATAVSYKLAPAGGQTVFAYGAVIAGVISIARGLRQFDPAQSSFPFAGLVTALIVPVVAGGVVYEIARPPNLKERTRMEEFEPNRQRREWEQAQDEKRRREIEQGAPILKQRMEALENGNVALMQLMSPSATDRCHAARYIGRQKLGEAAGEIERLAKSDPEPEVRRCAVEALGALYR